MTIQYRKPLPALVACLILMTMMLQGQEKTPLTLGMNMGAATWLNRCDVPAAEQESALEPSFGPFLSLYYGRFSLGLIFFTGHFHIDPEDGITRGGDDGFQFSDDIARRKRFTTTGSTTRTDVEVSLRYSFSRYAQLSLGVALNRHTANLTTFRGPRQLADSSGIILPDDEQNIARLEYASNQLWISEGLHGSVGIETVSNRFSWFYNLTALMIIGETGSGSVWTYPGVRKDFNTGHIAYRPIVDEVTGEEGLIFQALENRRIGTNAGLALSSGLGFEILDKPALAVFAGYSFKFFSEKETDLVDHSTFHGPYMGLSWNVF